MSVLRAAAARIFSRSVPTRSLLFRGNLSGARVASASAVAAAPIFVGYTIQDELENVYDAGRRGYRALSTRLYEAVEDEHERPILAIIGANIAVTFLWRTVPTRVMMRHFASSANCIFKGRPWTLLTANFSHAGALHFGGNMGMLWILGASLIEDLRSVPRFIELYSVAGVTAMAASAGWKLLVGRRFDPTIGASGAVLGVFAAQTVLRPEARRTLFGYDMNAVEFAYALAALDLLFAAFMRPQVAVMAHAGGAFAGGLYANFIKNDLEWEHGRDESWRALLQKKKEDAPLASTLIWRKVLN